MRTCKKNKRDIWITSNPIEENELDENGFFTGYKKLIYDKPIKSKINLYPANGSIVNDIFGENNNLDMLCVTIGKPFNETTLFYLKEPLLSDDLKKVWDFRIEKINESLNSTYYGLVRNVYNE